MSKQKGNVLVSVANNGLTIAGRFSLITIFTIAILVFINTGIAFADQLELQAVAAGQSQAVGDVDKDDASGTPQTSSASQEFSEQDLLDAQTNHGQVYIGDADVPLATFDGGTNTGFATAKSNGSVVNSALAVFCAVSMVLMMVLLARKESVNFKILTVRTIAVTVGLVTISTWSLFDKLAVPVQLFNESSVVIGVLFIIYLAVAIASFVLESVLDKRQVVSKQL